MKKEREELQAKLVELLAPLGFKKFKFGYRRVVPGGSEVLIISFIKHPHDFDATADVAMRMDDVETLLTEEGEGSRNEMSVTTCGAEIGNIADGRQKRWTVRGEGDVDSAATGIISKFSDVGMKFFNAFADRRVALEVLRKDDREAMLYVPSHVHRAKLALALCVVLEDSVCFERTLEEKIRFLMERNEPGLNTVVQFAERVRRRLNKDEQGK